MEGRRVVLSFDVGVVNLAYCLLDEDYNILLWNIVNVNASTYDKQCDKLIDELDKIDYGQFSPRELTVVIERQPCKNPKMRIVSGQIQMYFCLKKKNDPISKVVFYSPKFKLKCYQPLEGDPPIVQKKLKSEYAQRKNLAIQHCSIMIRRNQPQEIIDFFDKPRQKKDDLSDTYLQAVSYLSGFK